MLYIFVEGPDDKKFFEAIYGIELKEHEVIQYATLKKEKINCFLKSISSMQGSDYLFWGDEDGKGVENRKKALLELYKNLSREKLYIVQYEIESWYYAGISQDDCRKLKLKSYQEDTSSLTKEQFNSKLFRPIERKNVMSQILKYYSRELAQRRNDTFYCFDMHIVSILRTHRGS